jgi:hypothetical protein
VSFVLFEVDDPKMKEFKFFSMTLVPGSIPKMIFSEEDLPWGVIT